MENMILSRLRALCTLSSDRTRWNTRQGNISHVPVPWTWPKSDGCQPTLSALSAESVVDQVLEIDSRTADKSTTTSTTQLYNATPIQTA